MSREKAGEIKVQQTLEQKQKKLQEDKRNLGMAKEGLLNESNWIHQEPISKQQFELRQRLYIAKDQALKKSVNLFVSKTRLQIRNLPRRDFFEKELKELMKVVAAEWAKTLDAQKLKTEYKHKKLVAHIKIMRDESKTDNETGESLASGQAFVEFYSEELAMFAVRWLNNYELVPTKGLIVDFSMEDQRALFKRKEKIERWRSIAKQEKMEKQ
jgi:RNA recognition motif-containing protein